MRRAVPFGALALAAAVVAVLRLGDAPDRPRRPLGGASAGAVVRLETARAGKAESFQKRAGAWSSSPRRCESLVRAALALSLSSPVAGDPDAYAAYGVDEPQAFRLRAWLEGEAAPALDVYIGKPAFPGGSRYARLKDDPAVYLADGLPQDALSQEF